MLCLLAPTSWKILPGTRVQEPLLTSRITTWHHECSAICNLSLRSSAPWSQFLSISFLNPRTNAEGDALEKSMSWQHLPPDWGLRGRRLWISPWKILFLPLYVLPVRFPEVKGQEEGRAGRMLYPEATLPSSVCCLLIQSPLRHMLITKNILLHEAGTFASGRAGLWKLGLHPWGRPDQQVLWLSCH